MAVHTRTDRTVRVYLVPRQAGFAPPAVPHLMPRTPRSPLPRPRPRARHPLHTASMEHRCRSSGINGTSLLFAGEGRAAQSRRGRGWRGVRLTRHTAGPPQARTPHRPADPTASRRRAAAEANEICRGTSTSQELRRGPVIYSSEPHTEAVCKTAGFSKGHSEPRRGPHCRIWPCMRIKAPPRRGGAGPADAGPLPARV